MTRYALINVEGKGSKKLKVRATSSLRVSVRRPFVGRVSIRKVRRAKEESTNVINRARYDAAFSRAIVAPGTPLRGKLRRAARRGGLPRYPRYLYTSNQPKVQSVGPKIYHVVGRHTILLRRGARLADTARQHSQIKERQSPRRAA